MTEATNEPSTTTTPMTTTAMLCAACNGTTGEHPWYVLRRDSLDAISGPLCSGCAALYYPDPRLEGSA